ncbi:MAG: hypothetical protein ABSD59_24110 [Terracidiphilus sp.]|jgi:hypothetical protein
MNAVRKFLVGPILVLACSLATAQEQVEHFQAGDPANGGKWISPE